MKRKLGNTIMAVALAVTLAFAAGCSDDDSSPVNPGNGGGSGKTPAVTNLGYGATSAYATLDNGAMLRAVHASPDAPAVDVYVEGSGGSYTVELRGAGADASSAPVYTVDVTIPDNAKITAIAAGLLASSNDADKFRLMTFAENFDKPGAQEAIVRIVHASPDAPTVGIDVGDNGSVEVPDFVRFSDTGEAGIPLPDATELQIAILAGSDRVTAFTTPQLPNGAELFVIATGLLGKLPRETDGFSLLAVGPTGSIGFIKQNPVVFALHASPDAPNVDIYAGAAKLVEDLGFGELSSAIQVPPGSYDLDFKATGQAGTAATLTTPSLAAGERYLAIASGFLSDNPTFRLLPYGDSFGDPGAQALVRVVHASPDAPAVDVGTYSSDTVTPVGDFTNLAFEDDSPAAGTALPVGSLPIGIAAAGTTTAVAKFTVPTSAGLKAFAVAAGAFTPEGQQETFRLLIVVANDDLSWQSLEIAPNP
jgi:hypothetical protein